MIIKKNNIAYYLHRFLSRNQNDNEKTFKKPLEKIQQILHSLQTRSTQEFYHNAFKHRKVVSTLPRKMGEIEINDSCNLNCSMCLTASSTRQKGLMELDLFEKTIKASVEAGISKTNLHTIGDPLMNKKLPEYLAILRKYQLPVGALSSNCLLLERHLDLLFEFRDVIGSLRPSIDAVSKDIYEKIRIGGTLKQLHVNLLAFAKRNEHVINPFPVQVNSVVSLDNFHEIAFIPMIFSYITDPKNFSFHFVSSLSPDNEYFLTKSCFGNDYASMAPCSQLWDNIFTLKEGGLSCCCRDYNGDLVFAKIGDGPLDDLFNHPTIQQWRQAHLTGDRANMPKMCQKCFAVDSRLDQLLNEIFKYFYSTIKKHPVYLQMALDKILPLLQTHAYDQVNMILDDMTP